VLVSVVFCRCNTSSF